MALKYRIEYTNAEGMEFKAEIFDVNWKFIFVKNISGEIRLEYPSVSRILEAIKGSSITLDLEASSDLDLTDLYSENETDISVDFYIDNQIVFKGFILPDGIYTDFVNDIYTISITAADGLGSLDNLSFVDEDGFPFSGFMTEKDIVYHCLQRTSLDLPINTNIGIFHDAVTDEENTNILAVTKLSAERFIKDDENDKVEIMDCEEVLKSVLEKYTAVIHQFNGQWYIYRPQELSELEDSAWFNSIENGADIIIPTEPYFFDLGSQIDSYYPHHANANQRITIEGSVSAFRANYEYGVARGLIYNTMLQWGSGLESIDGWELGVDHNFSPRVGNRGLLWVADYNEGIHRYRRLDGQPFNTDFDIKNSQPLEFNEDDSVKISFDFITRGLFTDFVFQIKLESDTQTKYFTNGIWLDSAVKNTFNNSEDLPAQNDLGEGIYTGVKIGSGRSQRDLIIEGFPFGGKLEIIVYHPKLFNLLRSQEEYLEDIPFANEAELISVELEPTEDAKSVLLKKGEFHTALRIPKSSSIVEDNITVYNGDMTSDIYEGVIKNLQDENTSKWRHKGTDEAKKILQIMVEDTLKSRIKPQRIFQGDVYGFIPFLRVYNINNLSGTYMPISYIYDTVKNIVSLSLVEIPMDIDNIEIDYKETPDYGKTIKPTIK